MNQFKLATIAFTVALANGTDHVIRGVDVVQPLVMWSGTLQAIWDRGGEPGAARGGRHRGDAARFGELRRPCF